MSAVATSAPGELLEVVAYAIAFLVVFMAIALLWRAGTLARNKTIRTLREGALVYTTSSSRPLTAALGRLRYEDELGAGIDPAGFGSSLTLVADSFGIELWGGSAASLRLLMRTPWRDIASAKALPRVHDSIPYPGLVLEVHFDGSSELLPLQIYGGDFGLRPAPIATIWVAAEEMNRLGQTEVSGQHPTARNSRLWKALQAELHAWDVAGKLGEEDAVFEYGQVVDIAIEALVTSSSSIDIDNGVTRLCEGLGEFFEITTPIDRPRATEAVLNASRRAGY